MTSVIVASYKAEDAKNIRDILTRNGYTVNIVCTSGAQILSHVGSLQGGIVICSYRLQDMIYKKVLEDLPDTFRMILLASMRMLGDVEPQNCRHIEVPFRLHELLDAMETLMQEQVRLSKKLRQQPKKRTKEELHMISQAKQLLMEKRKMTEDEAHRFLQRRCMESGNNLVEMARMVLSLYGGTDT